MFPGESDEEDRRRRALAGDKGILRGSTIMRGRRLVRRSRTASKACLRRIGHMPVATIAFRMSNTRVHSTIPPGQKISPYDVSVYPDWWPLATKAPIGLTGSTARSVPDYRLSLRKGGSRCRSRSYSPRRTHASERRSLRRFALDCAILAPPESVTPSRAPCSTATLLIHRN